MYYKSVVNIELESGVPKLCLCLVSQQLQFIGKRKKKQRDRGSSYRIMNCFPDSFHDRDYVGFGRKMGDS